MADALKNLYTPALVEQVALRVHAYQPDFDQRSFIDSVFDQSWPQLELKQRMRRLTDSLHRYLPQEFNEAVAVIEKTCRHFNGFEFMFFPQYVERHGLQYFQRSMSALAQMTPYASAEFAIRPFIDRFQAQTMKQMQAWSCADNHHQRRLASEGCRPRLPWAMALPALKQDPSPIFPILETLKDDTSETVRRSVANNLNDISKDNADKVIALARQWKGYSRQTDWIIRHGCRTLLKQGEEPVLRLFGFASPDHITLADFACQEKVQMEQALTFSFRIRSAYELGLCRIEYRVYFRKANGSLAAKIFKISEKFIDSNELSITRAHAFRHITTRKHYPGRHQLEIVINGVAFAKREFTLVV